MCDATEKIVDASIEKRLTVANESPEQNAKLSDDELIDLTAKRILEKYKTAFLKLAENN